MKKILFAVLFTAIVLLLSCDLDSEETTGTKISPALANAIEIYKDDPSIVGRPGGTRVIELIKTLLSNDINAADGDGCTSLIYASQYRYTEIVNELIAEGANLEIKTTAPSRTAGGTALIFAAATVHTEAVEALVAASANVDAKNNVGFTALIYAAWRADIETIKTLIRADADVDAKTNFNTTALIYATWRGDNEAVQALIAAGAKK